MPMDPKVKENWAAALESGEYKQGKNTLCKVKGDGSEQFCCLGVLLNEEGTGEWVLTDSKYKLLVEVPSAKVCYNYNEDGGDGGAGAYLPSYFRERVGLTDDQEHKLANMNDGRHTFKSIAAWIRKNL